MGAAPTAEEPQEQAEVTLIGLDRHRAEPLLHRAVLEEARVQGGQPSIGLWRGSRVRDHLFFTHQELHAVTSASVFAALA